MEVLNSQNSKDKWLEYWESVSKREPFANPYYCELCCNASSSALCIFWEDGQGKILLPIIKRDISYDLALEQGLRYYDLTSPYGYGGPFFKGNPNWEAFWLEFIEWARKEDIVSCFIRFSLLIPEEVKKHVATKNRNMNIVRSLDISYEKLWYEYEHKVRKNVKRAINNNIEIKIDNQGITIDQFIDIYYETMQRRKANPEYYFGKEFFERIISQLRDSYLIFNAYYKEEIISTELVLISNENIYSFLGGTREKYFILRPNDLLKHEIIRWGVNNKKKNYILGGGYSGNDGIYLYKKSFAPKGEIEFSVAEIIINDNYYKELEKLRLEKESKNGIPWIPRKDYFPSYRG